MVAALHLFGQQPVHCGSQLLPALARFAGRDDPPRGLVPAFVQRVLHHRAPGRVNVCVGHDLHPPLAQLAAALLNQTGEQAAPDPHLIGGAGDCDRDHSHAAIPFSTLPTVRECGPAVLSTWIGAWL